MTKLDEEWEKLASRAILVLESSSFSCRNLRNDLCTTVLVYGISGSHLNVA